VLQDFLINETMTAHGMCDRFKIFELARHFRIEFESGCTIRIES